MFRTSLPLVALSLFATACGTAKSASESEVRAIEGEHALTQASFVCTQDADSQEPSPLFPLSVSIDGGQATLKTATDQELGAGVVSGLHQKNTRLSGYSWFHVTSNTMRALVIELQLTSENGSRAFGWGKVNLGGVEQTVFLDCK